MSSSDPSPSTSRPGPHTVGATFDAESVLRDAGPGIALVTAWTAAVDDWVRTLFARAASATGTPTDSGVALVAIGGYGRAQLCPASDLDLLLLHSKALDPAEMAQALWYPIWDSGIRLGHSVRTTKEALGLAGDDLDTATALLDVRFLAGDQRLAEGLSREAVALWEKRGRRWLGRLAESVSERHARTDEVAFLLEPDLKLGRGGLRDIHAVRWAERARQVLFEDDLTSLEAAEADLIAVRAELHRASGRTSDVLTLDQQDAVAAALDLEGGADALMALVADRARTVAWRSDETWHRVRARLAGPAWSMGGRPRVIGPGLELRDREVHLTAEADPATDAGIVLRAGAAAAARGARIDRVSLQRLARDVPDMPEPWPDGAREALVELLLAGPPAIEVIETLDQWGLWLRLLPEWAPVRNRPQRNAYHRFTVDRHLLETAVGAAGMADTVDRPDLLVLGGLFHDIGKGRPGDHTEVGMALVEVIGPRMGLDADDTETLVDMVRHHLLLPDVATRRDLDDPATYEGVAHRVGSLRTLRLLHGLTVADSQATGPAAWGNWKAGLVAALVERAAVVLGATPTGPVESPFPNTEQRLLLAEETPLVRGEGDVLTVVTPDRPGVLHRVAAALSLHGIAILAVDAVTSDSGWALERFTVEVPRGDGGVSWPRVCHSVSQALDGRLALRARLAEAARTHRPRQRVRSAYQAPPEVRVDNDASKESTVLEIHAIDGPGVLARIGRALADMDLDVRSAKVQTLGDRVVDAFYVRDSGGEKVTDLAYLREVERAVLHSLESA